jgi:hypothetical protein
MSGSDEPPKPNVSPDPTFGAIAAFKAAGDAFDIAYDVEESADDRTRRAAQLALDAASDTLKATRETLLNDPPTTFEGLAALLEFAATVPDIAEWLVHASDHVEAMRFFHTGAIGLRLGGVARAAAAWRTRHSV